MAPLQNPANSDIKDLLERSLMDIHARADLAQRVITRQGRRRRRRRVATGVGAAVLAAAAAALTWVALDPTPQAGPATVVPAGPSPSSGELIPDAQRRPAPALTGTTIDGKPFTAGFAQQPVAGRPGQITVVNFCGGWSAPCRAVGLALRPPPDLGNAAESPGSPASYVVVDERDSIVDARAFARRLGIDAPVVFDATGALGLRWHPDLGVPVTFVVDGDGLIAAQFDGSVTQSQLTHVIDALNIEQRGGSFPHQEFIAGVRDVITDGRRLTIEWVNDRCGNTVQAVLAQVRVRENVRAVHVEVLGRLSPAAFDGRKPNALTGCLGVGINSAATVTLQAPLGKRPVLEDSTGKALAVLVR